MNYLIQIMEMLGCIILPKPETIGKFHSNCMDELNLKLKKIGPKMHLFSRISKYQLPS